MKKVILVVILLMVPMVVNAENSKDMSKYSSKEVFLISDNNWKNVLRFVPATVWKEDEITRKYPFLIYHDETNLPELINFASSSIGAEIAAYNLEEHNYARHSSQFDDYIIPEGYDVGNLISNGGQVISEVIGSNPHARWWSPWLENRYCLGHDWCGEVNYGGIPPFSVVLDLGVEREFDSIIINTGVGNRVSVYSTGDDVNIHEFNSFNSAGWNIIWEQDTFTDRDSVLNLPSSTSKYIRIDLSDNPLTQAWWGGDSDEDGNLEYDCPGSGEDEDHTIRGLVKLEVYSTNNEDSSERSNFDADSIVYFLQMYEPSKVTIISNNFETGCGDNLDNDGDGHVDLDDSDCQLQALLYDSEEFGGGITSVSVVPSSQVLNYWEDYDTVVLVEDSYESSLLASSYASLINAPLFIDSPGYPGETVKPIELAPRKESFNENLKRESVPQIQDLSLNPLTFFEDLDVVLVGDISCPEDANCISYGIEELQEEYISLTNTDKVILVNPNDKEEYFGEAFLNTDLSNNVVTSLYSMQSLTAPYLAAAKEELILFMDLPKLSLEYGTESQLEVEQHVNSLQQMMNDKIDSLFASDPEFITIIASPNYISNFRPLDSEFFSLNGCGYELNFRYEMEEIENTVLNPDGDYKIGRIYGFTPSDSSSYVARSVFYDDIMNNLYDDEYTGLIVTDERHSEIIRNWYRSAQHQTLNYLKPEYDLLDCFWKPRPGSSSSGYPWDYSYLVNHISETDDEIRIAHSGDFTRVQDGGPFNDSYPYILKLSSKKYENGEFIDYGQDEIVACDFKDGQWFRECERGYDESPIISHERCTYTSSSNAQEGDICTWINLEYRYPYYCEPGLASFSSNPELYNYFSWSAFDLEDNKNKQFISVGDHGGPNALSGYYVDSSQISRYDLSYFFGGGCSTSDFFTGKQSTLGPNLLKGGVIGYHGAVEYANYFTTWAKVLCYATKDGPKTLGDLNNFVISQDPGDNEYTLLGDPTMVPRFRNNVDWEEDCEYIDGFFEPDWEGATPIGDDFECFYDEDCDPGQICLGGFCIS